MRLDARIFKRLLVAGSIALAVPPGALAEPATGWDDPQGRVHWRGDPAGRGGAGTLNFLRGLELSEAQRKGIFRLMHAQAPLLREKARLARQARDALHETALAGVYDEARVKALSRKSAEAVAAIIELRARLRYDIYQLLTPVQRQQLDARRRGRSPGGLEHG